jgi:hypothetical protein
MYMCLVSPFVLFQVVHISGAVACIKTLQMWPGRFRVGVQVLHCAIVSFIYMLNKG